MASWKGNKDFYALALLTVASFYTIYADAEKIGVCYGMDSDSLPSPNEVVNLLQSNNVGRVRLYEPNQSVMHALNNSGIEVIVGVGNSELEKIASEQDAANGWVRDNIKAFSGRQYISYLLSAMKNIQRALSNASVQRNIKVSTPLAASVLSKSFPPSEGTFGETEDMSALLKFLSDNDSPFMVNIYPYFSYIASTDSISVDYALFKSTSAVVTDGSLVYNNLFDAKVDTFISAMEK